MRLLAEGILCLKMTHRQLQKSTHIQHRSLPSSTAYGKALSAHLITDRNLHYCCNILIMQHIDINGGVLPHVHEL